MTSPIDDAVSQLQRHKGIARVGEPILVDDRYQVEIDIPIALPSRAQAHGVSRTGVRGVETCVLVFPTAWPLVAPIPLLRVDFPLDLPHINPHRPGEHVRPCIYEGSPTELLHRFGLDAIIDQLIDWLHKAAAGTLIDLAQGWEPTRRDSNPATVVFSAEKIIAAASHDGSVRWVPAVYGANKDGVHAILPKDLVSGETVLFSQRNGSDKLASGLTTAIVIQAPFTNDQAPEFSTYSPEAVIDIPSLLLRAAELGVNSNNLESALNDFYSRSTVQIPEDSRTWEFGMCVVVILLARRPAPLVGAPERNTEVLPYVVRYKINPKDVFEKNAIVQTAYHAHAVSPELLARTSGIPVEAINKGLVIIGCGSLGSKIGMHLGRAGFGHITFIDNELMSPHNAARYALSENLSEKYYPQKAALMVNAFAALDHTTAKGYELNALDPLGNIKEFNQVIPAETKLILDTTASLLLMVAEAQSIALNQSNARLARAVMYGQGRSTLLLLEGPERNARIDDLTAFVFESCRTDDELRTAIAGDMSDPARIFVGDNCRSLTMPMSDAVVSRAASLQGMQLEHWLVNEIPDQATLCAGCVETGGIGMNWSTRTLGQTTELIVGDDGGWSIRLLHPVIQIIHEDAKRWGSLETGGALIGRISFESRTIIIAGLVDAPPDSIREAAKFELGTEGLVAALRLANQHSLGYLQFIGTWHTHPQGGEHSGLDRETLRRIAEDAGGLPAISLVWKPEGFSCVVDRW
jgi:integrative and conjugative element protein (TIGR02256 family)